MSSYIKIDEMNQQPSDQNSYLCDNMCHLCESQGE